MSSSAATLSNMPSFNFDLGETADAIRATVRAFSQGATLQETATTVASRFASIKMTLLSIHGAFAVKSVQQIAGRQAKLDRQLTELRGRALKGVAGASGLGPGETRVAQAQQFEAISVTTKEIHGLDEAARKTTDEKFEIARQKFADARRELATLSQK